MARCVFGGIDSARLKRLCGVLARWLDETLSPFLCALSALVPPEHIDAGHGDEGGLGWIQKLRDKLLPWRLVNRHRVEIHQMVLDEIARCKRQGDVGREDILAMLCGARDEHGDPMSDDEIKDELLTLLIGGHETTAVTLTWALYHITRNPGVGRRISEEARRAFGDGPIAPERVGELVYMDAVINEAMRLTPVGICFPRKLNRARRVGRHELPAGTILLINTYLSHRRPDVWERPTAFHPERFLGKKPDPTTFFPFGGGQRRCIGGEFARQEMKIILAQLFSSMSISEAANLEVRPRFRGVHFSPPADLSIALRPCREATAAACA